MITTKTISTLPRTLQEFLLWEPEDGFKYEWNDGDLIQFTGMNKNQLYIYDLLLDLFVEKGLIKKGTLVAEYDVMLCGTPPAGIQMRRPNIAFLTKFQVQQTREGKDEIPEFVIEVISENDSINKVEEKVTEYFKAGVKVIWHIFPEHKMVYVYTSRKNVKICLEVDVCSANPVLSKFEISVNQIFA